MLRTGLRRLHLEAHAAECELGGASDAAFLQALPGLTSLQLDGCVPGLGPGLARLTGLRSLALSRAEEPDEDAYGAGLPRQVSALQRLTRLEFTGFQAGDSFPAAVGALGALRVLSLEGTDMQDHAAALECACCACCACRAGCVCCAYAGLPLCLLLRLLSARASALTPRTLPLRLPCTCAVQHGAAWAVGPGIAGSE